MNHNNSRILFINGNLCQNDLYIDYVKLNNIDFLEWWKMKDFSLSKIYLIVKKYNIFILHSAGVCLLAFILAFYQIKKKIMVFAFDGHGITSKGGFLENISKNLNNDLDIISVIKNKKDLDNYQKTILTKKYTLNMFSKYHDELNPIYQKFILNKVKLMNILKPQTNESLITWIQFQSSKEDHLGFNGENIGNNPFLNKLKNLFNAHIFLVKESSVSNYPPHYFLIKYAFQFITLIQKFISNPKFLNFNQKKIILLDKNKIVI